MAVYQLAVGQRKRVPATSRYLSIIDLNGEMQIDSPSYNIKPLTVRAGWQLDLDGIPEVFIENVGADSLSAEIEDAGLRIFGAGGGAVTITNKPTIKAIEDPLQFNATVSFDKGDVDVLASDNLATLADVTVPINTLTQIAPANLNRKSLLVQNIDTDHACRIGGAAVSGTRGYLLEAGGSIIVPATNAVNAYATTGAPTLTLTEV